eukprot:2700863-Karenia_brevis.AAC.1
MLSSSVCGIAGIFGAMSREIRSSLTKHDLQQWGFRCPKLITSAADKWNTKRTMLSGWTL